MRQRIDSHYTLEQRRHWWVVHCCCEGMATESGPFLTRRGAIRAWRRYLR